MRYLQNTKKVLLNIPAVITTVTEDDVTGVLVSLDIRQFSSGYSMELLQTLIQEAALAANLQSYKIHHDAKGLVLVGRPCEHG